MAPTAMVSRAPVFPSGIHVQSQNIPLSEWLAQLTLCFAPLATHVFTGLPTMVNQTTARIPWRSIVPLFNPTTIFWRYMMILDRRLRCRRWTPGRLAATNAAFFTDQGWTTSEQKMEESQRDLIRRPPSSRASLLSVSVLGTLVVAIQGVQALNGMIIMPKLWFDSFQGIATVFFPLAIISLFRLFPALWITQDFAFREGQARDGIHPGTESSEEQVITDGERASLRIGQNQDTSTEAGDTNAATAGISEKQQVHNLHSMRRTHFLPAIVLRIAAVLLFAGIFVAQCFHLVEGFVPDGSQNVSELMLHLLYHVTTTATLALLITYLVACRNHGRDILLPCINSTWYLGYTIVWYVMAIAIIIVSALEMRRTRCGVYTTKPPSDQDEALCASFA